MALYEFEGKSPKIGNDTYIAESADVIGDVIIGDKCYIGPGARIKGDYGSIRIGNESAIQENCVLHARPDETCLVGNQVNVGHGAILHNCTIKDSAVIGMGAIVSDWAVVEENAIIAEGCVVKQRQVIPAKKVAVGVPAKIVGDRTEEWNKLKGIYVKLAKRYQRGLKKIK
ncbi:MAG: gamma carbonic anhydrase family protein [Planctomycetes bacterium]|nr:gamma carbonic anhydrase family protein [Planctomycetota bacterium]